MKLEILLRDETSCQGCPFIRMVKVRCNECGQYSKDKVYCNYFSMKGDVLELAYNLERPERCKDEFRT